MGSVVSRDVARAIEWDCMRTLTCFFNYFDQWRYDDMVALFTPEAVWHRQGKALQGEAIMAALNARSRTQTVRHVITNIQVDVKAPTSADFILYVTAYTHDSGVTVATPPTIQMPSLLLVVPGALVKLGNDWKIVQMSMNREFVFGEPTSWN